VQFNPQQTFPGPPTPPGQHPVAQPGNGSAHTAHPAATADALAITKAENDEQSRRQGSNSDEEELTPAQSRRKAQNRAAYVAWLPKSLTASSGLTRHDVTNVYIGSAHSASARSAT